MCIALHNEAFRKAVGFMLCYGWALNDLTECAYKLQRWFGVNGKVPCG